MGGQSVQNSDFAEDIPEGDTEYYSFVSKYFPSSADVDGSTFGISFEVVGRDGTRHTVIPAPEKYGGTDYAPNANADGIDEWSWNVQFGSEYKFALESSRGGYIIYPTD